MKHCTKHWNMLKEACKSRGMWHLVHKDGEALVDATVRQLTQTDSEKDFDPLMTANIMITKQALEMCGLSILESHEGKEDYCPVCIPIKYFSDSFDPIAIDTNQRYPTMESYWTDGIMDCVLEEARRRNLMPRIS